MTLRLISLISILSAFSISIFAQSGPEYRRTGIHNANQVRSVFGNWGVIGQPSNVGPRGAWKNDNNGYLGDVSPFVGAEVRWRDTSFRSVVTSPISRPVAGGTQGRDESPTGKPWTFEPVAGYLNANQEKIAMSTDRNTWPSTWPDKMNDPQDPGWSGSWNGYFGKRINADQESYFVMDDNNDLRFNVAINNTRGIAFRPDSTNPGRNGLGLEVRVRGLQWAQFLAKDNIFWLYEITNTGTTNYDRAVFGMLVGTYLGVSGTDDSPREYDDDWSFYDVNNDITYTGDFGRDVSRNRRWVGSVGMVGYAFLESPGNPFDAIDNDGDADSAAAGLTYPKFTDASFIADSIRPSTNRIIVIVNDDFSRSLDTINVAIGDSVVVQTRGRSLTLRVGTKLVEGNVQLDGTINPNAYDGIDNDLDGLIDENQFVHYRQLKQTRTTPPVTLIDVLRPVRHLNEQAIISFNPMAMIDEKRTDLEDNDGDWDINFDDVGRDGIDGTGDFGEGDGQPTSGYDNFGNDTRLPGEPHIDKTDVDESDQIGLTSFFYFTNQAAPIALGNDETLWRNLSPGFFDVPPSIVNNRPESGEDGDFIYGSGYFPLLAKATERFSLALVYGGGRGGSIEDDIDDLLKHKKTVQQIYDANYQFPQPPDKPTLTVVAGDQEVTLYWDRKAEESIDPVLRTKDFEGYKIYRSTDPDFSDIFTITDATGDPVAYQPLAQYDLKNNVRGLFRPDREVFEDASGYSFDLGSDVGIVHSYVDRDVQNGRRYFYAVVAFDKGDESVGIFPGENTKFISILQNGEIITDINTKYVTPGTKAAGYITPASGQAAEHTVAFGTGSVRYSILDPERVTGSSYQVEFIDTQVDAIDNNGNGLADAQDSTEWTRVTTLYSVRDLTEYTEQFTSQDTVPVKFLRGNLIKETITVRDEGGGIVDSSRYIIDIGRGDIRGVSPGSLPASKYTISYQYYPVYRSPYIFGSPYISDARDADIFDGVSLTFNNEWNVRFLETQSGWVGTIAYQFSLVPLNLDPLFGYARPAEYEIQFADDYVDTSLANAELAVDAVPVKFKVLNVTENRYIDFYYYSTIQYRPGIVSPGDGLVLAELSPDGRLTPTWEIPFNGRSPNRDSIYSLGEGDKLILKTARPFRQGDLFQFTTEKPRVDETAAKTELLNVRVVPNPYIGAAEFEPPLNPGIRVGRERRIHFIHVPASSSIKIFTSRGEHVVTLNHDGNIEDGTVVWDLKTKENLDIAFGIYFYVLESPVGSKTGKIAVIK